MRPAYLLPIPSKYHILMLRFSFSLPVFSRSRWIPGLLAAAVFLATVVETQAQVPVNLASSNGNASTQTASYGITPSRGTLQFLLTTINPASSLPGDGSLGTTSANTNVTALNTYFGLAAGTLAGLGAQDGSGYLAQQVTLTIGTVLSFDYIFLTDEDNTGAFNNDRAFFTVNGVIASTIYSVAQLTPAQLDAGSNSPNFSFQSPGTQTGGYQRVSYTVPSTNNYTFGFGVIDVTTNTRYSGLLVDNINYSIVPEPGANVLLALGVVIGAFSVLRVRRVAGRNDQ